MTNISGRLADECNSYFPNNIGICNRKKKPLKLLPKSMYTQPFLKQLIRHLNTLPNHANTDVNIMDIGKLLQSKKIYHKSVDNIIRVYSTKYYIVHLHE